MIHSASQASSAGFIFTGATPGLIYNYTVTDGSGGSASGSGSVTSATQQVTGVNVSTLRAWNANLQRDLDL